MAASNDYSNRKRRLTKKLNEVEGIPREKRKKYNDEELYPIEIIECDTVNARVKIHYIGYSANEYEWRDASDIVDFTPPKPLISLTFFVSRAGTED